MCIGGFKTSFSGASLWSHSELPSVHMALAHCSFIVEVAGKVNGNLMLEPYSTSEAAGLPRPEQ